DLLDVSRINSGKIKLQRERIELADLIHRAVESVAPLIGSRRHDLAVTLPPQPVFLFADSTRLEQGFSNLLNNAAKYTPEGGHIWLTAESSPGVRSQESGDRSQESGVRSQESGDDSSSLTPDGEVVVTVRDDGVGIPEDMLERIFDLFAQV